MMGIIYGKLRHICEKPLFQMNMLIVYFLGLLYGARQIVPNGWFNGF
jgi:hypothetical protein